MEPARLACCGAAERRDESALSRRRLEIILNECAPDGRAARDARGGARLLPEKVLRPECNGDLEPAVCHIRWREIEVAAAARKVEVVWWLPQANPNTSASQKRHTHRSAKKAGNGVGSESGYTYLPAIIGKTERVPQQRTTPKL